MSDLDDELANQLIGIMLYLNAEEKSKDLYIYINSPGGSVTCGIARLRYNKLYKLRRYHFMRRYSRLNGLLYISWWRSW